MYIHKYVKVKNLSTFCIHMVHTYIIYLYIYLHILIFLLTPYIINHIPIYTLNPKL